MSAKQHRVRDRVREAEEEQELHSSAAARALIDVSDELVNIILWAIQEKYPVDVVDAQEQYGRIKTKEEKLLFSPEDYLDENTIRSKEITGDVFYVSTDITRDDKLYVSIEVIYDPRANVNIYVDKALDFFYVDGYEYPPASLESVFFFILNPGLERRVAALASNTLSAESMARLDTWRSVATRARLVSKSVDEQDTSNIYKPFEISGKIDLLNLRSVKPFISIDATFERVVTDIYTYDIIYTYDVEFRKDDKRLIYTIRYGNVVEALEELLKAFMNKRGVEVLSREAEKILRATREAYITIKAMKELGNL